MILYTHIESVLGPLLVTSCGEKLTGLHFTDSPHAPRPGIAWIERGEAEIFTGISRELASWSLGETNSLDLSVISLQGTPFQLRVWQEISAIPFGQTISYGELALRAGSPDAVRAAGAATGRNPVSWIIPCHRVVGKDGTLTGYAGGMERKKALLEFEKARVKGRDAVLAYHPKLVAQPLAASVA